MPDLQPFDTVAALCESEFTEKKSRFIGLLAPAATEAEALSLLALAREKYPGATHYVTAWTLREQNVLRFNDDGEPGGTAGRPALEVLVREGLHDAAFVSVRYFGGILLGAGGLVRAYTRSAKETVDAAERIRMLPCVRFSLGATYALWPRLARALETAGAREINLGYGAEVAYTGEIAAERYGALAEALRAVSAGAVSPVFIADVLGRA